MAARPLEAWTPQHPGIASALSDFHDMARHVPLEEGELEGDRQVAIPELAGLSCVAFVAAKPHKDLSHPRWSLLAPVRVQRGTTVGVRADGPAQPTAMQDLSVGKLVLLDTHSTHWVDPPASYPDDAALQALAPADREAIKRQHMSVLFTIDFIDKPTQAQAERLLAQRLMLPLPAPPRKKPRR